jgi:NAD(P)-dependent dehydrogenase (short-subunit alcohol dehydrogenase family)
MAAKSGVFALTRDTAYEGAEYGIRCNALTPAARTRMSLPYWGDQTENWDPKWASIIALFLASDLSAPITGRQFSLTAPGNAIREMYVASQTAVIEGEWTPELLAERSAELLHEEEPPRPGRKLPTLSE